MAVQNPTAVIRRQGRGAEYAAGAPIVREQALGDAAAAAGKQPQPDEASLPRSIWQNQPVTVPDLGAQDVPQLARSEAAWRRAAASSAHSITVAALMCLPLMQ